MIDTVIGGSVSPYKNGAANGVYQGGKAGVYGSAKGQDVTGVGGTLATGGVSFTKMIGKLLLDAEQGQS